MPRIASRQFNKFVDFDSDYGVDWSEFYGPDATVRQASVEVQGTTTCRIVAMTIDGAHVRVMLSGGEEGERFTLIFRASFNLGMGREAEAISRMDIAVVDE